MKETPDGQTGNDTQTEEVSAGGVVYRLRAGEPAFLVGEQRDWNTGALNLRLPKGKVDPGERLEQTAVREVAEETGRHAIVRERLGESRYRFEVRETGRFVEKRVVYFLLEDGGPAATPRDEEMQRVLWLPADEAARTLSFENERTMARRACERLADAQT